MIHKAVASPRMIGYNSYKSVDFATRAQLPPKIPACSHDHARATGGRTAEADRHRVSPRRAWAFAQCIQFLRVSSSRHLLFQYVW